MAINWKQGKKVTTIKPNQTMLVLLYKKGSKEVFKLFDGIGQITVYEKIDTSKYGCTKCGKPFDRKKNFINHWLKHHTGKPKLKTKYFWTPKPTMVKRK